MREQMVNGAEELRQAGLAKIRTNHIEESIPLFDAALELTHDDELRELITINKAGAMISLETNGPEVQRLPQIIMRRRNQRHLYLAAYNLQHKYQIERDYKRALFYANLALEAAEETAGATQALIALGNVCVYDSKIDRAIEYYESALSQLPATDENGLRRSFALQNLGYCKLLNQQLEEGVALILTAIDLMRAAGAEGYIAESYIDLCYGYLELGNLELAKSFGELALPLATEVRQTRNAHYLLGEVAYKCGDHASAEFHFEHLARYYPDFPRLKDLLLAIDLRGLVNLKL